MSNWEKLTAYERIKKVHIDVMRHPQFALLAGVCAVGKVTVDKGTPTACTNGRDVTYGEAFIMGMNMKQTRYLVLHENLHKALRHCYEYMEASQKYPGHFAQAIDYCVNGMIEDMDPKLEFVERPTSIPPLVDAQYQGWSMLRILNHLLKKYPPKPQGSGQGQGKGQKGSGSGAPGSGDPMDPNNGNGGFDEHEQGEGAMSEEELKEAKKQIDDAVRQGKMVQQALGAGNGQGGSALDTAAQERDTRWKEYLREFVTAITAGDDNSRFCPPNKRMLASGFIMPSHFTEATGELHIYCDTSGSMVPYYPIVFGEIAQIIKDCRPELVRVLWWDTAVVGEQVFEPKDYDSIATLLAPKGGGGTTPECVRNYVDEKQYKARCAIWLSDGDFYTSDVVMPWPVLWGIIGNDRFVPQQGRVVNINI